MAIADQSGFDAIQPPVPKAPYATRKIVRGPDGTPQVILVDMNGNVINDPSGYGIVEAGNYYDNQELGLATVNSSNPRPPSEEATSSSTARKVIQETSRGEKDSSGVGSGNFGRDATNNFGYVNKPGALGFAGALPGIAGLGGKAINAGINANNVAAVNAARGMMGLEKTSLGGSVLGVVKDNKGQVADVNIGQSSYATPVGLEALSPTGMTNMTPAEALNRAQVTGGMQIATPESVSIRNENFEAEFGKPGLFGRLTDVATNFVDSIFGQDQPSYYQPDPVKAEAIRQQNSGSNFRPTDSGFMDMLSGNSSSSRGERSSSPSSNPGTSGNMGKGAGTTSGHGPGIGSA